MKTVRCCEKRKWHPIERVKSIQAGETHRSIFLAPTPPSCIFTGFCRDNLSLFCSSSSENRSDCVYSATMWSDWVTAAERSWEKEEIKISDSRSVERINQQIKSFNHSNVHRVWRYKTRAFHSNGVLAAAETTVSLFLRSDLHHRVSNKSTALILRTNTTSINTECINNFICHLCINQQFRYIQAFLCRDPK